MLERQAAVARDVVGVRVRLQHAHDADTLLLGRLEVRLDPVRGVDDDRLACPGVADQIGGAAKIVVDELAEHHGTNLPLALACFLEARSWRLWALNPRRIDG